MGESAIKYLVRDSQGNIFGPADETLLRQWVREGRIIGGMLVAPRGSQDWVEVTRHPALADLLLPPPGPLSPPSVAPAPSSPATSAASVTPGAGGYELLPLKASQSPAAGAGQPVVRRAEGGAPIELTYATPAPTLNMPALLSVIAGGLAMLASVGGCCCIPLGEPVALFLAVTSIILGGVALARFRRSPERYLGRPLATIGLALGVVALSIALLLLAIAIGLVVAGRIR